ncbi:SIS domain-containing protein [Brenneria goodwinii]|uniref:SIS domain-containing protein n=1 Tax=Brenneria goodwinii TaxID=1109412 RepID=UPI000EF25092|nr:SIS domain-containing protein [Brenneria goodwinii]MCG8158933.1 SIS domain-containing protein [Brenneria goodwinii]MCG8163719.1 SIS domain-containing protein [Brenneria goodwinii]MCG8166518.1 SIS domain-containing protein [Brenneria goodwinii]MCG8170494.1 SIS domain-containing protein [Brenneria goodwinii]MCG8177607.1 SIS domain-containing protein [Brenneria goodwinii]
MRYTQKIIHNKAILTPGERKIADYVLENPDKLKRLSSQGLAAVLGISQSSIIKFAQKLGLKGFTDFKMALIEEWGQQVSKQKQQSSHIHNAINSNDSLTDIAEKLCAEKQKALQDTTDSLDFTQLQQAVSHIQSAKRIQITGVGGSSLVAKDLAYKLMKIGYPVMNELDSHVQITVAQSLSAADVQIIISFSGKRRELLIAADAAKKNGATLIAITSLQHNPLRELADYTLDTIADETRWRSSSISARTAQNAIIDLLFVCLLQKNSEDSRHFIEQSQTLVDRISEPNTR